MKPATPTDFPTIFFATRFFGRPPLELPEFMSSSVARLTTDRRLFREADAVVFHIPEPSARPPITRRKYRRQLWVAWSKESAVNYPQLAMPDFMRHFDLRMTYRRDSEIWTPYLPRAEQWVAARTAALPEKLEPAPMTMFQSAPADRSGRIAFAAELMRHMRIDSYGTVLHNRDLGADLGTGSKLATLRRYRFCLSLENAIEPDYVTEKLFEPLLAGCVPVYRGAPNAGEFAPPHSFIDASQFDSPKLLAAYLHHLCETPDEYQAYFRWRQRPLPPALQVMMSAVAKPLQERLAEAVMALKTGPNGWQWRYPFGLRAQVQAGALRLRAAIAPTARKARSIS